MFDFIIKFIINNKSESFEGVTELLNFRVGKIDERFSLLSKFRDLFKVVGVIKIDKIKFIIVITIEIKRNKFIILIFLTPDVHNITNSFSCIKCIMKIVNVNKKDRGTNLVAIPKEFNSEKLK